MTTALAALLIGVAGAALLIALAAYLWVNRTPSVDERFDEYGRVPLFGVDVGAPRTDIPTPPRSSVAVADDEDADDEELAETSHADAHASDASAAGRGDVARTSLDASSDSRFSDPAVNGTPTHNGLAGANGTATPPAANSPLQNPPRRSATSWGETPGWPVAPDAPLPATPTYVPPVRPDVPPTRPQPPAGAPAGNGNRVYGEGVPGSMVEGHQFRFSTPVEGTLQFLPGRLEISSGLDTGREIRFVRVPGPNGTEVTFGRNEGPLYRHIQLRDQTVSREHARLLFAEGQWVLTNLSRTNPVLHNGRILRLAEEQPLSDGDRLEMGEVVFNFRSR